MSPELEQKLIEKYPILFQDRNKPVTESCMYFGCEFSDGWYKLLDELCEYLTKLSKREDLLKLNKEYHTKENHGFMYVKPPTISFSQVKEKFGKMRIYWIGNGVDNWEEVCAKVNQEDRERAINRYYDEVQNAIDYVEFLSSKVCEDCGEPGKLYTNGWYMTKCKKHIIERYGFDPDEIDKEDEEIVKL